MRTPKLTQEELVNYWFNKAYGVNIMDLPEEVRKDVDFFRKHMVDKSLHDEWYEWAIQKVMKAYRIGKKRAKREFCFTYLNVAPSVKEFDELTNPLNKPA